MTTTIVDYSDIISPVCDNRTVESNVAYNLHMTGRNVFDYEGFTYQIETDPDVTLLHRHNAMTNYNYIYNWLILATSFGSDKKLFYLVKVKNNPAGWARVSCSPPARVFVSWARGGE